jgi:hypothetical protein
VGGFYQARAACRLKGDERILGDSDLKDVHEEDLGLVSQ